MGGIKTLREGEATRWASQGNRQRGGGENRRAHNTKKEKSISGARTGTIGKLRYKERGEGKNDHLGMALMRRGRRHHQIFLHGSSRGCGEKMKSKMGPGVAAVEPLGVVH